MSRRSLFGLIGVCVALAALSGPAVAHFPQAIAVLEEAFGAPVAATGATDGQALAYNATTGQWEATTLVGAASVALDDLTDVTATDADGNFMVGTGSGFVMESGATARASLGAQAQDDGLDDIAGLAVTDGNVIVGDGTNWVAESGATARASLGAQAQDDELDDLAGQSWADGDVIFYTSGALTRLAVGTAGQVLTVGDNADAVEWADATGGSGTPTEVVDTDVRLRRSAANTFEVDDNAGGAATFAVDAIDAGSEVTVGANARLLADANGVTLDDGASGNARLTLGNGKYLEPGVVFGQNGVIADIDALQFPASTTGRHFQWTPSQGNWQFRNGTLTVGGEVNFRFQRFAFGGINTAAGAGALDTWLTRSRDTAGVVNIGATEDGTDGTLHAATLRAGENSYTRHTVASQALTSLSGASVTTTGGLIPAGAVLKGVTVLVDTEVTGATSFDVGDGTDVDRFAAAVALTAGTATAAGDATADPTGWDSSAREVTLTANGSNFSGGDVTVFAHYELTVGGS